jgi:hypothetical protein
MRISVTRYFIILSLISVNLGWYAESFASIATLCPQASDRAGRSVHYGNLNKRISAPVSQEAVREQFQLLDDPVKEQRFAAIMALAMAGNIELFERLVAKRDRDGLSIYASHYLNSNGNRCIDPVIEKTLIQHHQQDWLQPTLQRFFPRNLYRTRDLFKVFLAVAYQPDNPQAYSRYARALTSTNLPDIEPQVLQKARGLLSHTTPKQKNNLPGIHQAFIKYFARRQYTPALDYMRHVLQAESRDEPKPYFLHQYAATRNVIYSALGQIPSKQTNSIYLEELAKLAKQPWGGLFSNELHQILKYAVKADKEAAYQDALLKQLVEILQTPSLPGQKGYVDRRKNKSGTPAYFDYQVRKNIYERVAELGSHAAANLLMDELQKVRQSSIDMNRDTLTFILKGVLLDFSPAEKMDVARLISIFREFPIEARAGNRLLIMKHYLQPNNVELFLSELDEMFITEAGSALVKKDRTLHAIFDHFMQQQNTGIDTQLRDRLDRYYQLGNLNERKYLRYVRILNKRLGDESQSYKTLMAEKAREQEQRQREKVEKFRQAQQQKMQALYDQHASQDGIRKDIQALGHFGSEAKQARYWLVRVGAAILPYAHKALQDPASNTKLKMQLMTVLGEIGDVSSTAPIIATAQSDQDNAYVYKNAFLALSKIPQSQQARAFADSMLTGDRAAKSQRSALVWYAQHRDPSASHWASKFSEPGVSEELRYAALYLAARLNLEHTQAKIKHELQNDPDMTSRRNLLRALAEVASVDDYITIAKQAGVDQQLRKYYELHLLACRFQRADTKHKPAFAKQLLEKRDSVYKREVIRYLIKQQQAGMLSNYLGLNNRYGLSPEMVLQVSPTAQLVFSEARRLGYQLKISEDGLKLQKIVSK